MRELIDNLATETYDHLQHMPYRQTVNQYGPEVIVENLYGCID